MNILQSRLLFSIVLAVLCSQSCAKFFEQGKTLTKEQEDFLLELADIDDALWEQETRSLFNKYSKVLNATAKEITKATKVQQDVQNANVIVFKLPESELFTPEGINLTAVLAALNRSDRNKSPEPTKTEEIKPIETETRAPTTLAPVVEIVTSIKALRESSGSVTTLRSDINNSTEIAMDLSNNTSTEPGTRNETTSASPENHIFSQVQKIITASAQRNISGILDASLGITGNTELTNFVNGIFGVVYCNALRRLLGRC